MPGIVAYPVGLVGRVARTRVCGGRAALSVLRPVHLRRLALQDAVELLVVVERRRLDEARRLLGRAAGRAGLVHGVHPLATGDVVAVEALDDAQGLAAGERVGRHVGVSALVLRAPARRPRRTGGAGLVKGGWKEPSSMMPTCSGPRSLPPQKADRSGPALLKKPAIVTWRKLK